MGAVIAVPVDDADVVNHAKIDESVYAGVGGWSEALEHGFPPDPSPGKHRHRQPSPRSERTLTLRKR